jgi:hypothetical protein
MNPNRSKEAKWLSFLSGKTIIKPAGILLGLFLPPFSGYVFKAKFQI